MSPGPYTVSATETVAVAQKIMDDYQIRHLPVTDGEALVGILSMRDLQLVQSMCDINAESLPVREVMSADPYSVEVGTSLRNVAINMNARKYGCTVVKDGDKIVGLFTTVDALRVLANLVV